VSPQGHSTYPSSVIAAKIGQVKYTTRENIPKGEPVLMGTFFLNDHSIVILFDTEATNDFIGKAWTKKHQLAIEPSNTSYMISTLGGKVITKQLVMFTPLNLRGKLFRTSLIVLYGQ
jgi:hypothetical protein